MSDTIKYLLPETEIPKDWYNIVADLPEPVSCGYYALVFGKQVPVTKFHPSFWY